MVLNALDASALRGVGLKPMGGVICNPSCCKTYKMKEWGLGVVSGGVDCLKRVDFTGFGLQPVGGVVCKPSCCETDPMKERVLRMASGGVDCLKRVTFGGGG